MRKSYLVGSLLSLTFVACSTQIEVTNPIPVVLGISKNRISLGETVSVVGTGFQKPTQGSTILEFSGVYYWRDSTGRDVPEGVLPFRVTPLHDGVFVENGSIDALHNLPVGTEVLRWNRFGPFQIPFGGSGNHAGTFIGQVRAINLNNAGQVLSESQPMEVTIEVAPSIRIAQLEPILTLSDDDTANNTANVDHARPFAHMTTAGCKSPALRALAGIPYLLSVEAVGITPSYFVYELAGFNQQGDFITLTHPVSAEMLAESTRNDGVIRDYVGDPYIYDGELLVFNAIAEGADFNIATIRVTAIDENNQSVSTALPIDVVRPLRFFYDGERKIAEYYEPEVVHGPIIGGIGTVVTYSESHSEARQNAVAVTFSRSFAEQKGRQTTDTWSEAYGTSNTTTDSNSNAVTTSESATSSETYGTSYTSSDSSAVSMSSQNGTDWSWSLVEGTTTEEYNSQMQGVSDEINGSIGVEIGGKGSVPGLAEVSGKVGTTVGARRGTSEQNTVGQREANNTQRGSSTRNYESDTSTFGSTTTDATSSNMSGSYAVSQQSSINQTRTQSNAQTNSLVYQMGGSTGSSESYTTGNSESWAQTWVATSTDTNLLSFSGKIPNGRCAVVYRQTVRHVRTGHLYSYDLCGVREEVGEMYFNEWSWSPNIAIGDNCETSLPSSTQPKAQCFFACE